jgi:hypothetical protein
MQALLAEGWDRLRARANSLSIVLEVTWGALRLVLGGDLPVRPARGTGWDTVMQAHPHLVGATANKIAHHASRDALHDGLLSGHAADALWWVTPFSSSRLPKADAGGGLTHLLTRHGEVKLTSLPHREAQRHLPSPPAAMDLAAYRGAIAGSGSSAGFVAGATDIMPPRHTVLDPVWAASFDETGAVCDVWRGPAAFAVTR